MNKMNSSFFAIESCKINFTSVIPAEAGIPREPLDSRFRGNDIGKIISTGFNKKLAAFIALIICLSIPLHAEAEIYNDAKIYVKQGIEGLTQWWHVRSVGSTQDQTPPTDGGKPPEGKPDEKPAQQTDTPGICQVPQRPPIIVCEKGSGFLCVNTPEPSVADESVIVKGTLDRGGSTPASVSVSAQHDYTKKTVQVDTTNPESSTCWESTLKSRPFCLDADGFYAVRIPLDDLGPYTIAVGASRLSGQSVTQTVRTSRVVAPVMNESQVTLSPDVRTQTKVDTPYVNVTVSLLGDCQNCDFIGASTFGVSVTVENVMRDATGHTSRITCLTNVEQGGQGKFVLGVPVGPATNELTITACNAATANGTCPTIKGITFQGGGGAEGLEIKSPPPQPSYASEEYPTIPFQFKIPGIASDTCVDVMFNRQGASKLCPSPDGLYTTTLHPQTGINVITVESENFSFPWVFGWGPIISPFGQNSDVSDGVVSNASLHVALPAVTITDMIAPMLSNVLSADELGQFIASFLDKAQEQQSQEGAQTSEQKNEAIPLCDDASKQGEFKITDVQEPQIGSARIEGISFEDDNLHASINADNVKIDFKLMKDGNADGKPDQDLIPLRISFRKAVIDVIIQNDGKGHILISSPHTDCDFKKARFCKKMPSALIPQNLVGDATPFGGFVTCHATGSDVPGSVKEMCAALNSLNAQTGLVNEKVLDAINQSLYCQGSAALTKLLRESRYKIPVKLGPLLGSIELPVGFDLADGFDITKDGLFLTANIIAGSRDVFSQMPQELHLPSVGVLSDGKGGLLGSAFAGDEQFHLAISADAINSLIFALTEVTPQEKQASPHGLLDMEISEPFFNKAGFDFVTKCDAFLKNEGKKGGVPSPLCNLRPRVLELLGTPLTKYGYFPAKQPLLVRIEGNRALPIHVSVVNEGEIPVVTPAVEGGSAVEDKLSGNLIDLQVGGLVMSFYALEVDENQSLDEYGNMAVKLDQKGNPIILSMRPEDTDPTHGQIASFELTLLLAVELGDVVTDPNDPSRFVMRVRPLADRSRLVISPVAGSNTTTIPARSLISSLREKLQYGIAIYSSKESAILIPIPKTMSFEGGENDLVKLLGIRSVSFGPTGLKFSSDAGSDSLTIDISAVITQLLHHNGEEFQDTLPH